MATYLVQCGNALKLTSGGVVSLGISALSAQTTSGTYNTCVGYQAGNTITSGTMNTIVGYDSDVAVGTGRGTVIGAGASITLASTSTLSIALGYGTLVTANNVCAIGNAADAITVVEYGPHFGLNYNEIAWEGEGTYTGSGTLVPTSAAQVFDGLLTFMNLSYSGYGYYTVPSAASVMTAIPNWVVGTAFYLKVGVYDSAENTASMDIEFGTGWLVRGPGTYPYRVPGVNRFNGCINFLCVITGAGAITAFSTGCSE